MEPDTTSRGGEQSGSDKLYTLSEVSQRTGISMPTLQRYKKAYQSRIPSVGKGRKQRYPESALPVFGELKNENAGRRGRPRKDASAAGRRGAAAGRKAAAVAAVARRGGAKRAAAPAPPPPPPAKRRGRPPGPAAAKRAAAARVAAARGARAQKSGNLMTLTQISEQTGISYPTLVRYVRLHSDRLPSEGTGRSRRFYPEAVGVFRTLRQESPRGGRKKGTKVTTVTPVTPAKAAKRPGRPAKAAGRGRAAATSSDEGLGAMIAQRLKALERSQENIEKRLRGFVQSLQKLFS